MNKRVLLLGGTGAMGNHLADDLRKNGESCNYKEFKKIKR